MTLTNTLLKVNNLSKIYYKIDYETEAVRNITFDLNEGDFIGIVGPSGCGKSTILNIICGLDEMTCGEIIKKENIKIGYMLQEDALFPWLTIFDNAILGLKISKKLTDQNKNYVLNLLRKYDLIDFKDKYPNELSGGMKQRLALIRTLAMKPDILLLDEPFSALDYQTRLSVSEDVYNIIKEEKKSVIIVTHDLSEAISLCSKIIVLSKRPSVIKNIHEIKLYDTPIQNRKSEYFSYYYDLLWKEIDK
jgi:NitT/TauT family transport system ATP-binding protein